MEKFILGMFAETFIHPGAGQTEGAIDLPVAREATTDYPFIAGSSMKGALRDKSRIDQDKRDDDTDIQRIYGKQENAGEILVSDARILLLPIRSLSTCYRWVTCPLVIERLLRDCERFDIPTSSEAINASLRNLKTNNYMGKKDGDSLYLEEREFSHLTEVDKDIFQLIEPLIASTLSAGRLAEQLVILHNDDFAWFARNGLPVNARNVLNVETKESENLWYEETLPPDTLMYSLIAQRNRKSKAVLDTAQLFSNRPYIQTGGNETVGQGCFATKIVSPVAQTPDASNTHTA